MAVDTCHFHFQDSSLKRQGLHLVLLLAPRRVNNQNYYYYTGVLLIFMYADCLCTRVTVCHQFQSALCRLVSCEASEFGRANVNHLS